MNLTGVSSTDVIDDTDHKVIRHKTAAIAMRDYFLKWQCRARQNAVRRNAGKPSQSMIATIVVDNEPLAQIVLVVNRAMHFSQLPELRHMVLRTQDPRKRYDSALEFLSAEYYQDIRAFTDELTALFGPEEPLVERLKGNGNCTLDFNQTRQKFTLPGNVTKLDEDSYLFQATYWHNRLFSDAMPAGVQVLAFKPDWLTATAEPGPT